MKKTLLIIAVFALIFGGCEKYEDFVQNEYDYTAVYFTKEKLERTTVAGEGLSILVGVNLGGVRENSMDRIVNFEIAPELLDGGANTILPQSYYTLSNPGQIIIPKGKYQGFVEVSFDSESFVEDSLCLEHNYALPFRITSVENIDTILSNLQATVIPIKYISTYAGNFNQVGVVKQFTDLTSSTINQFIAYGDEYDHTKFPVRELQTNSDISVRSLGIGNLLAGSEKYYFDITVNPDNTVSLDSVPGAVYGITQDGECSWDPVKRTFFLNYTYENDGMLHKVEEKLIFRNRIRDGINEWRWEGFPGNY